MSERPRITAIVPTRGNRPTLLRQAIDSVWRQQGVDVEVMLVVDGPELGPIPQEIVEHPRVEVVRLAEHNGQRTALDAGVARARAPWVAFLDDDDVWHDPSKLAKQHAVAAAGPRPTIVSSRVLLEINGRADRIAPPRAWTADEDLGEFAFCVGRRLQVGLIQQSTLFLSTDLARAHPFSTADEPHPDIGMVLECVAAGADFVQLPDALSTWRIDDDRVQMSTSQSWQQTLSWCDSHLSSLTRRAYAGALLTSGARSVHARRAMPAIWRHAFGGGRPRFADLVASLYLAYVPRRLRRRISAMPSSGASRRSR